MRLTEDEIVASLPPWYTQVSPAQLAVPAVPATASRRPLWVQP
jgi:hypothetical protein